MQAVYLDADDPSSVAAAFTVAAPVDVVYYLVHAIGQPDFRDRDNAAAANVAAGRRRCRVRRIVYLGGFVPDGDTFPEHLAGRAEVADALSVEGGPELVWLGAAVIIGAGSTSFEMVRYVGDRFWVILLPRGPSTGWIRSRCDVLYYLLAAADPERVAAGAYDLVGPTTTTYRRLLGSYVRAAGERRAGIPVYDVVPRASSAGWPGAAVPVPNGLAADLIESLDHPMTASDTVLGDYVPDPPDGLTSIDDAVAAAVSSPAPRPVDQLADPHHLADSDPLWAGVTRSVAPDGRAVSPAGARPALASSTRCPDRSPVFCAPDWTCCSPLRKLFRDDGTG